MTLLFSSSLFAQQSESLGGQLATKTFEVTDPETGRVDKMQVETVFFVIDGEQADHKPLISNADKAVQAAKSYLDRQMILNPNIKKFTYVIKPSKEDRVDRFYRDQEAAVKIAKYLGAESAQVVFDMAPGSILVQTEISQDSMHALSLEKMGERNKGIHYVLAVTRAVVNGAGVFLGLSILPANGLPLEVSIPMATLSGLMSGLLMVKHVFVTKWFAGQGYVQVSDLKRASFTETLIKDGLLTVAYVGAIHFLRGVIEGNPLGYVVQSGFPFMNDGIWRAALLGAISEGFWNANISHGTKMLLEKYPEKRKLIWDLSRVPVFTLSLLATFGTVVGASGIDIGNYVLLGLFGTALVTDLLYVGNLKRLYDQTKNYARSLTKAARCQSAFSFF